MLTHYLFNWCEFAWASPATPHDYIHINLYGAGIIQSVGLLVFYLISRIFRGSNNDWTVYYALFRNDTFVHSSHVRIYDKTLKFY